MSVLEEANSWVLDNSLVFRNFSFRHIPLWLGKDEARIVVVVVE